MHPIYFNDPVIYSIELTWESAEEDITTDPLEIMCACEEAGITIEEYLLIQKSTH